MASAVLAAQARNPFGIPLGLVTISHKAQAAAASMALQRRRGRVVRQRPAKPRTAVRIRSSPSLARTRASTGRSGADGQPSVARRRLSPGGGGDRRRRLSGSCPTRPSRRSVVARPWTRENRRVQPELPTGTVTFLFTDIEGSTRLLRELGDGYAAVLAEHHRVLRDVWVRHRGVEVDTAGDAFFVAFARASDAVAAAAGAQRRAGGRPCACADGVAHG